jgi:hypothetical protein
VWDGIGLGLVVAGAHAGPIGRTTKTLATELSEDLRAGLPHVNAKLGMSAQERMLYDAVHTSDDLAAAELKKLTPQQLGQLYPEGGVLPWAANEVARIPGFAAAVVEHPEHVRRVIDAQALLNYGTDQVRQVADAELNVLRQSLRPITDADIARATSNAFKRVSEGLEPMMPPSPRTRPRSTSS